MTKTNTGATRFRASASDAVQKQWKGSYRSEFEVENMMFYQQRSRALDEISGKEAFASPQDALDRATEMVASSVVGGKVIENYEKTWLRDFGHLFPNLKGFPETKAMLKAMYEPSMRNVKEFDEAVAGYDFVVGYRRGATTTDKMRARIVSQRIGMSMAAAVPPRWLGGNPIITKPMRAMGNYLVKNPDPIYLARSAAFVTQILSAPVKQWVINAPTLALHMGISPTQIGRAHV